MLKTSLIMLNSSLSKFYHEAHREALLCLTKEYSNFVHYAQGEK